MKFKLLKKDEDGNLQFPLINLVWIIIPTVIIIFTALYFLWNSGAFLTESEKLIGEFSRTRKGAYSSEVFTETYKFSDNGKGVRTCISPDGYKASENFTWSITEKKTLVINGHVKYAWNTKSTTFFDETARYSKKMWYVSKDGLYFGDSMQPTYEAYKRTSKMQK